MRTICIYLVTSLLLLCTFSNCRKKCVGEGERRIQAITAQNKEWFNFPEGTRIPYENNLGEKDTAVFGPIRTEEESCCHNEKECYTVVIQKLIQEITWVKGLKGRIRPVKIIGKGGELGTHLEFTEVGETFIEPSVYRDTITYNGRLYNDVLITRCDNANRIFKCLIKSKTHFYLSFTYMDKNQTEETWTQK